MSAAEALSPTTDRPELSLVFPVFDEVDNIGVVLTQALELAPRLAAGFEIIVVDDGSQDGSDREIDAVSKHDARVRSVRHASNQGYGAALRSGLRVARGERVFFSDADLQFDLAELADLLEHADRFDIVAGYRSPRRDPIGRRVIAWIWGSVVRLVFGLRVRDIDCAFKVFRREVIDALALESIGAFVNTEILVRAERAGFRIRQMPVTHRPRTQGRQSGARPRVILRAAIELVTLYRSVNRQSRIPAAADGAATEAEGAGRAG